VRYGLPAVLAGALALALIIRYQYQSMALESAHAWACTETQIQTLVRIVNYFKQDMGRYPTKEEGLTVLVNDPGLEGWDGPYLNARRLPRDPWGIDFRYQALPSDGFEIVSAGPDRVFGSKDDIKLQFPGEEKEMRRKHSKMEPPIGLLVKAGKRITDDPESRNATNEKEG
jgi:general secretion pathway protein G